MGSSDHCSFVHVCKLMIIVNTFVSSLIRDSLGFALPHHRLIIAQQQHVRTNIVTKPSFLVRPQLTSLFRFSSPVSLSSSSSLHSSSSSAAIINNNNNNNNNNNYTAITTLTFQGPIVKMEEHQEAEEPMSKPILGKIVTSKALEECGARLREGNLVSFPTETVYGLGCHALDPEAVNKVFQAKERPLTDPLIVHVSNPQDALSLWEATAADETNENESATTTTTMTSTELERRVLQVLCQELWPGPLTIVAKAASHVPQIVMANTGYVACRCPSHPLASRLIQTAKVPIAAPSANKFGHVSPTKYHHVWDDLKHEDVWILKEEEGEEGDEDRQELTENTCRIGVESTVAKLSTTPTSNGHCNGQGKQENEGNPTLTVTVLRQGAVSAQDIQACLYEKGLLAQDNISVQAKTQRATADHVANVAPGQTIRHYSPKIQSFLVSHSLQQCGGKIGSTERGYLSRSVILDYGQTLLAWKEHALEYRDLSATNNSSEAAQGVFDLLRWAEQVDGCHQILFPDLSTRIPNNNNHNGVPKEDALKLAVKDRLTRAASGVIIDNLAGTGNTQ